MIPSSVPLKLRSRLFRLLAPISVGATLLGLTVAACSVPQFEFPTPPAPGSAGEPGMLQVDHCQNKQLDTDLGESDFDCGGGCTPCDVGQHCMDLAGCATDLPCHDGT